MLPLEIRKYLYDIQQACELLNEFTANKTFTDYTSNAMLRAAYEDLPELPSTKRKQTIKTLSRGERV